MLLIAALSCRGGDIMKTQSETQHRPFLCYDDITIKLVDGVQAIENLVATVVIRNEKGKKLLYSSPSPPLLPNLKRIDGPNSNYLLLSGSIQRRIEKYFSVLSLPTKRMLYALLKCYLLTL